MAWAAAHPSSTREEQLPVDKETGKPLPDAPHFRIGFWPPLESERMGLLFERYRKFAGLDPATHPGLEKEITAAHHLFWDMVRYGVRSWRGIVDEDGVTVEAKLEEVEIDGRKHQRLTEESMLFLQVNHFLGPLTEACWCFNVFTPAQKKSFGLRLPSSSSASRTAASGAMTDGRATSPPAASSDSKTG